MSMPKVPSPVEDPALYANSNGEVLRAYVTLLVLPAVFVTLRLTSRYMAGAGLWVGTRYATIQWLYGIES